MNWWFKNWAIQAVLFGTVLIAIGTLTTAYDAFHRNTRFWPIMLIFIGSGMSLIGSFVSSYESGIQQNSIQETGHENKKLSEDIKALESINTEITINTAKLVEENHKLTEKSLDAARELNLLLAKVEQASTDISLKLNSVQKEMTGANSIPLVHAKVKFFSEVIGYTMRETDPEVQEYNNQWIIDFSVENIGNYPIQNIEINQRRHGDIWGYTDYPYTISLLRPKQQIKVGDRKKISKQEDPYPRVHYTLTVKWKIEYKYILGIFMNSDVNENTPPPEIEDYYEYKNVKYTSSEAMIEEMLRDL